MTSVSRKSLSLTVTGHEAKQDHHDTVSLRSRIGSLISEQAEILHMVTVKETAFKRYLPLMKLILLACLPLLALVALSLLSLSAAREGMDFSASLTEDLVTIEKVKKVVASLQRERGGTCLYLSASKEYKDEILETLSRFRVETDSLTDLISEWLLNRPEYKCSLYLSAELSTYRIGVGNLVITCEENLEWYTKRISCLLAEISSLSIQTEQGSFWAKMFSLNLLLQAQDLTGIKRAMGSTFFGSGGFDQKILNEFTENSKLSEILLQIVEYKVPYLEKLYKLEADKNWELINLLDDFETQIRANDSEGNATKGMFWFQSMTKYMAIVGKLENSLSTSIVSDLERKLSDYEHEFWLVFICITATIFISTLLSAIHGIHSHWLMERVKKFTIKMSDKNKEIKIEKQKTVQLLCQMLPRSVAQKMLSDQIVEPEKFDSVTIYFSDIKGFTKICGDCTPFQVIELLNDLYSECDSILDMYDVYKVETIGDAYMVASGLPEKNGSRHSSEVCTMALEVLLRMQSFTVPHKPDTKLSIRIGIHTGPCAAGVVGRKMPRYCLFGDTVNVASRMESNGMPDQIHLSPFTEEHLRLHHPEFSTRRRGMVSVKGKGRLQTYWLTSKKDFPFVAQIAERESNQSVAKFD